MNTFRLTVLEADQPFFDGECISLQFPYSDGLYGIMAGHINLIAAIVPGMLRFRTAKGEERIASVSRGIIKVENGDVLILIDSAEDPDEIDVKRAEREAAEAAEAMLQRQTPVAYRAAEAKYARALNRLKVYNKVK